MTGPSNPLEDQLRDELARAAALAPVLRSPSTASRVRRPSRSRRAVLGAVAAVAVVSGGMYAVHQAPWHHTSGPTKVPTDGPCAWGKTNATHTVSTLTCYPKQSEKDAVTDTLAGMGPDVVRLSIGTPRAAYRAGSRWADVTMDGVGTNAVDGSRLRLYWEASLAEGAVAQRIAGPTIDLNHVISGGQVGYRAADGSVVPDDTSLGAGDVRSGQVFGAQADGTSDDTIRADVEAALRSYHLTPTSIDVLRPLGPAVAIVATATDLDALKDKSFELQNALLGKPARYEGLYLEIDAPDGLPLARTGAAFRSGGGSVWLAPGMDAWFGILHGGSGFDLSGHPRSTLPGAWTASTPRVAVRFGDDTWSVQRGCALVTGTYTQTSGVFSPGAITGTTGTACHEASDVSAVARLVDDLSRATRIDVADNVATLYDAGGDPLAVLNATA